MREMSIYKRYCYYCTTDFHNGASTTAGGGADGSFCGALRASPQEEGGLFEAVTPLFPGREGGRVGSRARHHSPPQGVMQ